MPGLFPKSREEERETIMVRSGRNGVNDDPAKSKPDFAVSENWDLEHNVQCFSFPRPGRS